MTTFPADVSSKSLTDLISLKGKVAVVTGAWRGIGRAIARRLSEAGAAVLVTDVNAAGAQETARAIAAEFGGRAVATTIDVSDVASISAGADFAVKELGGIDIWVNNAGIYPAGTPFVEMTSTEWDRVIDINLRGTFAGIQAAAKRMIAAGRGGVIINNASTAGFNGGSPSLQHYTASKWGVRGLTASAAVELAPYDIRVLAVAPNGIFTEGTEAEARKAINAGFAQFDESMMGLYRRKGNADDVARVVLFCASELSLWMTGSTLVVDAGRLSQH
jgi:NAD(P)-dependent dehydrogenase (short-subunit alcohol dehydrogenase family)